MEERNIDKVQQLVGRQGEALRFSVEAGAIRRYADAIGDNNPLHTDEEAASAMGTALLAPPGFFGWPVKLQGAMPFYPQLRVELITALAESGFCNLLDGSLDYEFFTPVAAGDVFDVVMTIKDIALKHGKSGDMVICALEFTYCRPDGALAAKVLQKIIAR